MIAKDKHIEKFPAYSMVLDPISKNYLATYLKMYQLYYLIDRAFIFENSLYHNHFIRLTLDKDEAVFPWLEFVTYEVVDLINGLHTLSDGVYTTNIKAEDFLKTLNFELFWEQLEDWAEYISLEDFKDKTTPNLEYIFKMFKCTEHWLEKYGEFPKAHKDYIADLMINIDEYYATHILNSSKKGDVQISTGVLALEEGASDDEEEEETPPHCPPPKDAPEEDTPEEEERSIKADIAIPKIEEHGIYSTK